MASAEGNTGHGDGYGRAKRTRHDPGEQIERLEREVKQLNKRNKEDNNESADCIQSLEKKLAYYEHGRGPNPVEADLRDEVRTSDYLYQELAEEHRFFKCEVHGFRVRNRKLQEEIWLNEEKIGALQAEVRRLSSGVTDDTLTR
jgi:hypothetical protein